MRRKGRCITILHLGFDEWRYPALATLVHPHSPLFGPLFYPHLLETTINLNGYHFVPIFYGLRLWNIFRVYQVHNSLAFLLLKANLPASRLGQADKKQLSPT